MNTRLKSRSLTAWQAVILLNAACVHAIATASTRGVFLVLFGGALAVTIRHAIPFSSRRVIYGAVLALGVTTLENQIFPESGATFFLDQAPVLMPALLYAGTALLFFEQRQFVSPLITSFGLLILLMVGGVIALPTADPSLLFPPAVVDHFKTWYRCAAGVQVTGMVMVFSRQLKSRQQPARGFPRRFRVLWAAALLAVFAGAAVGERVTLSFEPEINRLYMRLMQLYLRGRIQRVIFDKEVNLWRTSRFRSEADKTIVLRAFSDTAPGYLRGRVYRDYTRGIWTSDAVDRDLPAWPADGMGTYGVFRRRLPGDGDTGEWLSFLPEVRLESEALFLPGTTRRIELTAETVSHSDDGVVTHKEWDQRAGYKVERLPPFADAYPLPELTEQNRSVYLTLEDDQKTSLAPFVDEAFADSDQSDRDRIRAAVDYLQSRCSYKLGVDFDRRRRGRENDDPVIQFLATTRQGHCELFATAAVLLLRARNVPARYVTGLVCHERMGGYWVARLEHAHAWAEAYDANLNKWVLVEATPPAGVPADVSRAGWIETWLDSLITHWRAAVTRIRRGELAEWLIEGLAGIWRGGTWLVRRPLFWIGLTALAAAGVRKWRARDRKNAADDPDLRALRQLLTKMERHVAGQGLRRSGTETIAEFIDRIKDTEMPDRDTVIQCLNRYERLRYHHAARSGEAVQRLNDDWKRKNSGVTT
ncbi:MAG: transglutaminase domain-containing protein [Lentisphaeria bacterium]|nr:transglutaminase domain-containing protein [Lentisphaeria bacterium]